MIFGSISKNIEESEYALSTSLEEKKLMNSLLKGNNIEEGKLIKNAINYGIFSFNPDMVFEQFVKNYSTAKQIYGDYFLKNISANERDLSLPEIQRRIKRSIKDKFEDLIEKKFINRNLEITEKGLTIAALSLYIEELDKLMSKGLIGDKLNKEKTFYGDKENFRYFKTGDRYRDLAIKRSVKLAIRRTHRKIENKDLIVFERESKGKIYIIYALDASGSMKGKKIDMCKKAGLALAFKAINEKDSVGLIVFGSDIESIVEPTHDFYLFIKNIAKIRAKRETNIAGTILKSIEMFPSENVTKHLILITDAIPTFGKEPVEETFDAVNKAYRSGITISVIGISLDEEGKKIAEKMSELGDGKFYIVNNLNNLDYVVLQDYYSL